METVIYRTQLYGLDLSEYINITNTKIIVPDDYNNEFVLIGVINSTKYIAPFEMFSYLEFKDKIQEYYEKSNHN